MRRLIIAALLTLVVVQSSQTGFAQDSKGFTGHTWRTLPISLKTAFIRGFSEAFWIGYAKGHFNGTVQTYVWFTLMCQNEKKEPCVISKSLSIEKMMDETDKANLDKFKPISESTEYLVKEIDSFYEAFPLRRGQFIEVTLAKLFAMWSGIATNDESSYNKIGAACGEQK